METTGKIDPSKPTGFYYVGHVTQASIDSMPPELRGRFKLNDALSNTKPYRTKVQARKIAEAHFLRDITIIKN